MTKIPVDRIVPWVGVVGFRGAPDRPPDSWTFQHRLGEIGGYPGPWRRNGAPLQIVCAPVTTIYKSRAINEVTGWCVDDGDAH